MKKFLLSVLYVGLTAMALTACKDDPEFTDSRPTYYAVINLNQGDLVVKVGESFTDPGAVATLKGEDVSDQLKIKSNVNTDEMGIYTINYSFTNSDGFTSSSSRNVFVTNPGHFDNLYYGESEYGTRHYYNAPVKIEAIGNGQYLIDDICAGFYWNGRYPGYEPTYDFHAESIIQLNEDNTLTFIKEGSWYFGGDPFGFAESSAYDPKTGVVTYSLDGSFEGFKVILTPIE